VRLNRTLRVTPLIVLLAILAVSPAPVGGQSADSSSLEQISSRRYIVIDDKTGEIFAEKDPDERAGMASVTKVFTALVALERAPLDMEITTNDSDLFDQTSSLMPGLVSGKTYTMQDLLYGMVLASGNDAAHALARGIGEQPGDSDEEAVARFVTWMNDKVTQLGLANTHFVNPHGLSDPDHYTTPRDIATFMMYAVQNPDFMDVISALEYTTTTGDFVASINRGPQFIPDFVGGKTGFDFDTGYCLVEVGQRGDVQVVSVTIDGVAPDIWYQDHAILMDYAFAALEDRLAAGDPLGENVLAFAQQGTTAEADTSGQEVAQDIQSAAQESAFAGEPAAPRPVLVTEPVQVPAPVKTGNGQHIFDNWLISLAILMVVGIGILLQAGIKLARPSLASRSSIEIDTPA
jgi:D-alanyl-D-alanine carboxypeptidase (penicillin-binding protein 5/6)